MHGQQLIRPVLGFCLGGFMFTGAAMATSVPAGAYYGDTFTPGDGTGVAHGNFSNVGPEINASGNPSLKYTGLGTSLSRFEVPPTTQAQNGTYNSGASTGIVWREETAANETTLLLPKPTTATYSVGLDVLLANYTASASTTANAFSERVWKPIYPGCSR